MEESADRIIDIALAEDLGRGDITSDVLIPPELEGKASILVKKRGVLAGVDIARQVFSRVDPSLKTDVIIADGTRVKAGDVVAIVSGRVASILKAERTAINFLTHLSGVASATARYTSRVRGSAATIKDTRKTIPGLRAMQKYAVRMGGGQNHRADLGDGVLIKDNHLAALRALGMDLKDIVNKAKQNIPHGVTVEVEVTTVQEALEAAEAGADIIMLDNMSHEEMRRARELVPRNIEIEASGGITLANLRDVASTGADIISIGALTHSVKALDMSLELEPQTLKLL